MEFILGMVYLGGWLFFYVNTAANKQKTDLAAWLAFGWVLAMLWPLVLAGHVLNGSTDEDLF